MIVLMYHGIPDEADAGRYGVAGARFDEQMAWLRRGGWQGLSLKQAMTGVADTGPAIVLTFDDGYENVFTNAWPILARYGFSATVFVPAGYLGGVNEWETSAAPRRPLLSWDEAAQMAAAGIEFGSHTVSHLDLRQPDVDTIRAELVASKRTIERRTPSEVVSFAYPYGYFRPELPGLLAETGYRYAVLAATYGRNTAGTNPYRLNRVPIWGGDSLREFAAKVRGLYCWRYYTSRAAEEWRWVTRRLGRSQPRGH